MNIHNQSKKKKVKILKNVTMFVYTIIFSCVKITMTGFELLLCIAFSVLFIYLVNHNWLWCAFFKTKKKGVATIPPVYFDILQIPGWIFCCHPFYPRGWFPDATLQNLWIITPSSHSGGILSRDLRHHVNLGFDAQMQLNPLGDVSFSHTR